MAARPRHIAQLLAQGLNEADRIEVERLGFDPETALRQSLGASVLASALILDGQVGGMWGVAGSLLGGVGQPWLLTGPGFLRLPFQMVRQGRIEAARWLRIFPKLENYADAGHTRACRYLGLIGYALDEPKMTARGHAFRRFWMERG